MGLSMQRSPTRVPRRLPLGATYVVEGYGGAEGKLRVIARYLLLPDGNRINLRGDLSGRLRRRPRGHKRPGGGPMRSDPSRNGAHRAARKISLGAELSDGTNVDVIAPGEAPQPLTLNHPASNPGRSGDWGSFFKARCHSG